MNATSRASRTTTAVIYYYHIMTTDALLFAPRHESHIILSDEATVAMHAARYLHELVVCITITTAACFPPQHEYAVCRRPVMARRLLTPCSINSADSSQLEVYDLPFPSTINYFLVYLAFRSGVLGSSFWCTWLFDKWQQVSHGGSAIAFRFAPN